MAHRPRNRPVNERSRLDQERHAPEPQTKRALSPSGGRPRVSRARTTALNEDVTKPTPSEELLREAQRRTESILASVTDTHIVFDRQWHYAYVNEAAVRAIGRARDQVIGRTLWELYPDTRRHRAGGSVSPRDGARVAAAFEFHYLTLDSWWHNRFNPCTRRTGRFRD